MRKSGTRIALSNLWIGAALFCAMRYIDEGRYLAGNEARELDRVRIECKDNVELYQTSSPGRLADFQDHPFLAIQALRSLDIAKSGTGTTAISIVFILN